MHRVQGWLRTMELSLKGDIKYGQENSSHKRTDIGRYTCTIVGTLVQFVEAVSLKRALR